MQGKLDSAAQDSAAQARATAGKLMEQALDATGHPEASLKPVMKPVSAPTFAARPVVSNALHSRSFAESSELRRC